jgi:cation transport ATPase
MYSTILFAAYLLVAWLAFRVWKKVFTASRDAFYRSCTSGWLFAAMAVLVIAIPLALFGLDLPMWIWPILFLSANGHLVMAANDFLGVVPHKKRKEVQPI